MKLANEYLTDWDIHILKLSCTLFYKYLRNWRPSHQLLLYLVFSANKLMSFCHANTLNLKNILLNISMVALYPCENVKFHNFTFCNHDFTIKLKTMKIMPPVNWIFSHVRFYIWLFSLHYVHNTCFYHCDAFEYIFKNLTWLPGDQFWKTPSPSLTKQKSNIHMTGVCLRFQLFVWITALFLQPRHCSVSFSQTLLRVSRFLLVRKRMAWTFWVWCYLPWYLVLRWRSWDRRGRNSFVSSTPSMRPPWCWCPGSCGE